MIQDGIMGELSLTKPFIGCYLGSEFSELNRPLIDNETRNFSILPKSGQGIGNENRPQNFSRLLPTLTASTQNTT